MTGSPVEETTRHHDILGKIDPDNPLLEWVCFARNGIMIKTPNSFENTFRGAGDPLEVYAQELYAEVNRVLPGVPLDKLPWKEYGQPGTRALNALKRHMNGTSTAGEVWDYFYQSGRNNRPVRILDFSDRGYQTARKVYQSVGWYLPEVRIE